MIESLESRIAPATFTVTTLADSGVGSLRDAIADANDAEGSDVIVFKKGLTGIIELTSGEIQITDTLAIKGPGATKLAVSGGFTARIFQVLDAEAESPLAVSGLTFFGGSAKNLTSGGAILSSESLKVTNCIFKSNDAEATGGAITVFDGSETAKVNVEIRKSLFSGNRNGNLDGGAVSILVDGSVVVKACTFTENASNTRAGALGIGLSPGGIARIEGCQFLGNQAPEHGALGIISTDAKAVIARNFFTGNRAFVGAGGAMAIFGGDLTFDRNVVSQNTSDEQGGGLFTAQFTSLKISNSRFLDNASQLSDSFATGGGAISIGGDEPEGSVAQIVNCMISGNTSTRGGGIYVEDDSFLLKIIGTTIAANRSGTEGGGIFVDSTNGGASMELVKSTITGNVALNLGGGIFSSGIGAFSMKASKVTLNNSADGAGLHLSNSTVAEISGSLFARNYTDGRGGGLVVLGELEVSDTKFIANTSRSLGGAIHSSNRLDVVDCTITGNVALLGGGIFQQSGEPLTVTRSKVIGNISNDGKQVVDG